MSEIEIYFTNGNKVRIPEEKAYISTGEHFEKMIGLVGLDKYEGKTFVNLDNVCMLHEARKREAADECSTD